jgi:hypothetical protein
MEGRKGRNGKWQKLNIYGFNINIEEAPFKAEFDNSHTFLPHPCHEQRTG